MGFLRKGRFSYHGGGHTDPSQTVHPSAAVSTSGVFTPTIINPPDPPSQKVTPLPAISTSVARTPTVFSGNVPTPGVNDWVQIDSVSGLASGTALANLTAYYSAFASGGYGYTSNALGDGSTVKAAVGSFSHWKQTTLTTALIAGQANQSFSVADPYLNGAISEQTLVFGPSTTTERAGIGTWSSPTSSSGVFSSFIPPTAYPIGSVVGISQDAQVTLGKSLYIPLKHAFIHTKVWHGAKTGVTSDLGGVSTRGIPPAFAGDNSNNTWFNTDDKPTAGVKRDLIIRTSSFARIYFVFYGPNVDGVHPFHVQCDNGNWNYPCLPNPGITPDQLWGQYEDRVIEWKPATVGTTLSSGMSPDSTSDGVLLMWINGIQIFNITNGRWGTEKMVTFQGPSTYLSPKFDTSEIYEIYPRIWEAGQVPGAVVSSQVVAADSITGTMTIQLVVPSTDATGVASQLKVQRFVSGSFQDYVTIDLNPTPPTDNRITGRQTVTITGLTLGNTETLQFAQSNGLGDSAYGGSVTFNVGALAFTGPTAASLHPYTPSTIVYGSDFSTYTTTAQINNDNKFKTPNFIAANANLSLDTSVLYNSNKALKLTTNANITWDWHTNGALTSTVLYARFRHFPFTLGGGRRRIWQIQFDDGAVNSSSVFTNSYSVNNFSFEFLNKIFAPVSSVTKKGGGAVTTNSWAPAAANLNLGNNFSQDGAHAYEFAALVTPIITTSNGGIYIDLYMRRDDATIWKRIGRQTIQDPTFNTATNPINVKKVTFDSTDASGISQRWLFDAVVNDTISDFDFSTSVPYTPY